MMMLVWVALVVLLWWGDRRYRRHTAHADALSRLASHDALLHLPNRSSFLKHLEVMLHGIDRQRSPLAVLFLDLDNFKLTNNSLGHAAGDQLLVIVAQRLRACLPDDTHIARIGGDEFTIVLPDLADADDAVKVAERIAKAMSEPIQLFDHEIFTSLSIGIACNHSTYEGADILLRDAHAAMCHAKARGHGQYQIFDTCDDNDALARLTLESDLRRAVERSEFQVVYQPIISLESGEMVEAEALMRWNHPRRGLLLPAEFIAVAEETGLILPMGYFILREASRQATAWHQEFPEHPIQMSVNLSARQFQHSTLVSDVAQILEETGLQAKYLKLEITESVLMHDVATTLDTLRQLKALGVRLAVDDFGTGYSSLNYLTRFPVDVLKIDRSFVDRLGVERESTAIIAAIITLANSLNLEVVGEGLEHAEQSNRLQALGCNRGQGYYFAKPLPNDAIRAFCGGYTFPRTAPNA